MDHSGMHTQAYGHGYETFQPKIGQCEGVTKKFFLNTSKISQFNSNSTQFWFHIEILPPFSKTFQKLLKVNKQINKT